MDFMVVNMLKNLKKIVKNSCLQTDENYNLYFSDSNHISNFGAKIYNQQKS